MTPTEPRLRAALTAADPYLFLNDAPSPDGDLDAALATSSANPDRSYGLYVTARTAYAALKREDGTEDFPHYIYLDDHGTFAVHPLQPVRIAGVQGGVLRFSASVPFTQGLTAASANKANTRDLLLTYARQKGWTFTAWRGAQGNIGPDPLAAARPLLPNVLSTAADDFSLPITLRAAQVTEVLRAQPDRDGSLPGVVPVRLLALAPDAPVLVYAVDRRGLCRPALGAFFRELAPADPRPPIPEAPTPREYAAPQASAQASAPQDAAPAFTLTAEQLRRSGNWVATAHGPGQDTADTSVTRAVNAYRSANGHLPTHVSMTSASLDALLGRATGASERQIVATLHGNVLQASGPASAEDAPTLHAPLPHGHPLPTRLAAHGALRRAGTLLDWHTDGDLDRAYEALTQPAARLPLHYPIVDLIAVLSGGDDPEVTTAVEALRRAGDLDDPARHLGTHLALRELLAGNPSIPVAAAPAVAAALTAYQLT